MDLMNYRLIDTHCHLDIIEDQGQSISTSLEKAKKHGVSAIVQIGINYENSLTAQKIISQFKNGIELRYTIGCHPADDIPLEEAESIYQLVLQSEGDSNFIGIGEIGLDYYHKKDNMEYQKSIFRKFIELAIQKKLPIIVHSRDAAEDTYQILSEYSGKVGGIIHCFTYDYNYAKKFCDLGFYISFSGIVAFKNAVDIHEAAKNIPLENILIETDAPFLSPPPHRGKRNEPSYIVHTFKRILELRTENVEKVEDSIYQNSLKFINKQFIH